MRSVNFNIIKFSTNTHMKKYVVIALLFGFVLFTKSVKAYTSEPSNIEYKVGETINIDLRVKDVQNASAVQVRLDVKGAKVVGFQPADGLLAGPACPSSAGVEAANVTYIDSMVCVDLVSYTVLKPGELLGTVTVEVSNAQKVVLTKRDQSLYLLKDQTTIRSEGEVASFSVTNYSEQIPESDENTSTQDDTSTTDTLISLALVGVGLLIIAVFLVIILKIAKK